MAGEEQDPTEMSVEDELDMLRSGGLTTAPPKTAQPQEPSNKQKSLEMRVRELEKRVDSIVQALSISGFRGL